MPEDEAGHNRNMIIKHFNWVIKKKRDRQIGQRMRPNMIEIGSTNMPIGQQKKAKDKKARGCGRTR